MTTLEQVARMGRNKGVVAQWEGMSAEARATIPLILDECARYCQAESDAQPPRSEARRACRKLARVFPALAGEARA